MPINPEKAASTSLALWNVRDVLSTDLRSEKIVSCFSHTHTPLDRGSVIFWKQRASLQWGRSLSPAYKGVIPQVRAFAGPSITPPVHSHISDLHSTPNYKPQPLPRLYVAPATARMSFLLQHHKKKLILDDTVIQNNLSLCNSRNICHLELNRQYTENELRHWCKSRLEINIIHILEGPMNWSKPFMQGVLSYQWSETEMSRGKA